jgi:hypothetical protein
LAESIVKITPDLATVASFFSPSDARFGVKSLDQQDLDFGSGGVLLLPDQPGFSQGLAIAAGKVGQMYLLNRANLGGYNTSNNKKNKVLGAFSIGDCWCGQSYFQGPDNIGRVVSSGGNNIIVWKVQTSPSPNLKKDSVSPQLTSGQDGGFFTTVSSNGTQNAVIWAVGRPVTIPGSLTLYALDPLAPGSWLYSAATGNWASGSANANIVPVVANGHVYVASNQQLSIFGLGTAAAVAQTASTAQPASVQPVQTAEQAAAPALTELPPNGHEVFGTINNINGDMFTLTIRKGDIINVDATQAMQEYQSVVLLVGEAVRIIGTFDSSNVLQATVITRAKASPRLWPPDR